MEKFNSKNIRKWFGESDAKRDAGLVTPEDIERFDNIAYGADKEWQILDVYRPKAKQGEKLPVIIIVHGGGWVYGTKEVYQFYGMSLAQRGFAVVNFTYRLAPEFKFPAAIEDTNSVISWIFENEQEFGFDTNNIFGVGDSAGGHLLSVYSTLCTSKEYAAMFDFEVPKGFVPRGVALNCGVYYVDLKNKANHDYDLFMEVLADKGSDREQKWINPMPFMTEAFPPTYLMTANQDKTVSEDQALKLSARLEELNVNFLKKVYGDKENPLDHVFHCNMRLPQAAICNDEECQFFKSLVK